MTDETREKIINRLVDLKANKAWLKENEDRYNKKDWWEFQKDESTMTLEEVLEFVESLLIEEKVKANEKIIRALTKEANYCGRNMAIAKDELAKAPFTTPQLKDNIRKWSYPLAEFEKLIRELSREVAELNKLSKERE